MNFSSFSSFFLSLNFILFYFFTFLSFFLLKIFLICFYLTIIISFPHSACCSINIHRNILHSLFLKVHLAMLIIIIIVIMKHNFSHDIKMHKLLLWTAGLLDEDEVNHFLCSMLCNKLSIRSLSYGKTWVRFSQKILKLFQLALDFWFDHELKI